MRAIAFVYALIIGERMFIFATIWRRLIKDRARAANDDQDFSRVIREGLPQSD